MNRICQHSSTMTEKSSKELEHKQEEVYNATHHGHPVNTFFPFGALLIQRLFHHPAVFINRCKYST